MKKTLDSNMNPHEESKSKGNNIEKYKEQYKYIFCSKHFFPLLSDLKDKCKKQYS